MEVNAVVRVGILVGNPGPGKSGVMARGSGSGGGGRSELGAS